MWNGGRNNGMRIHRFFSQGHNTCELDIIEETSLTSQSKYLAQCTDHHIHRLHAIRRDVHKDLLVQESLCLPVNQGQQLLVKDIMTLCESHTSVKTDIQSASWVITIVAFGYYHVMTTLACRQEKV